MGKTVDPLTRHKFPPAAARSRSSRLTHPLRLENSLLPSPIHPPNSVDPLFSACRPPWPDPNSAEVTQRSPSKGGEFALPFHIWRRVMNRRNEITRRGFLKTSALAVPAAVGFLR